MIARALSVAALLALLSSVATPVLGKDGSAGRPNFVFIFIDDMGYGDLNCYGNAGVRTQNINRLAEEGIRFTNFYVSAPICSPSRVGVTTGQYPVRWGITSFLGKAGFNEHRGMVNHLDPDAPSLARFLHHAGYHTAHVGKWHMGGQRNVEGAPLITEYGFDASLTSFEGLGERIGYIFETKEWNGSHRFHLSRGQAHLEPGPVRWVKRHNSTETFVDRALEEIQTAQRKDKPFYINLWPDAVHTPIECPPQWRGDGSREDQYLGLIWEVDRQLGRVFDTIRQDPELSENTVILLSSDNGPSRKVGRSGGLRGHKGNLYEGGIREPFIVWSPGLMGASRTGTVNRTTAIVGHDLPPSLLAIAGVSAPAGVDFDGLDMSEALLGQAAPERGEPIVWLVPPNPGTPADRAHDLAVREGTWKLLVNTDGSRVELYNLATNPAETINLAGKHPSRVRRMKRYALDWFDRIVPSSDDPDHPWSRNPQ